MGQVLKDVSDQKFKLGRTPSAFPWGILNIHEEITLSVARVPVAPKMTFNSCLIFSISGPQSACAVCPRQLFQQQSKAALLKLPLWYGRTFQRNRRRAAATFWRHSRGRPGQHLCPNKSRRRWWDNGAGLQKG